MTEFICSKCDICTINNHRPMIGDGNLNAAIMFVTRNPSAYEMKNNIPLYNKDGMLFQRFLELFNFHRDYIFVTNAVKCKTPGHRYPTDKEIDNCRPYLEEEIKNINPKIIVLMGLIPVRSYFKLTFRNVNFNAEDLIAKYLFKDDRIILFMTDPYTALKSQEGRVTMYNSFLSLLNLYRTINPAHTVNF